MLEGVLESTVQERWVSQKSVRNITSESNVRPTLAFTVTEVPSLLAMVTLASLAFCTTWAFVTIWPSVSHTKPDPVPAGISKVFRLMTSYKRVNVSMYVTDGVAFEKISMTAVSVGVNVCASAGDGF